jgi:CheY-like chemotaxis protein
MTQSPSRLLGASVLVVDDMLDTRDLLRSAFERRGSVVCDAASAADALAVMTTNDVNLIISDIGMPERDGFFLISAVREAYVVSDLPAIAYTAMCSPDERKRALKAGFNAHVCKQADLQLLLATAESLLEASGASSAASAGVIWK